MTGKSNEKPFRPATAAVDAQLDTLIGERLRSYYDALMAEPVPDKILELVAKLEAKDRESETRDKEPESR